MIKNVIFDWSGVLDDNLMTQYCASMEVLKSCGVKRISLKEYREEFDLPYMVFYRKYSPGITKKHQDEVFKKAFPKCPKSKLYPGMKALLKRCESSDKKIYLVTSDHKVYLDNLLKKYGISRMFADIKYSVHNKYSCINNIIKKEKLNKTQTIFIGDTLNEVAVSKKLSIKSAGVTWGICSYRKLRQAKPDYIFQNIKNMNKVIFSENEPK